MMSPGEIRPGLGGLIHDLLCGERREGVEFSLMFFVFLYKNGLRLNNLSMVSKWAVGVG